MNMLSGLSLLHRDFSAILSNRPTGSQERAERALSGEGFPEIDRREIEVGDASIRVKDIAVLVQSLLMVQAVLREGSVAKGEKPPHEYYLIGDMLETLYSLAQVSMRRMVMDLHDMALPQLSIPGRFALRKGWKVVYSTAVDERSWAFAMTSLAPEPALAEV